jgi:hypothetical protein
VSDIAITIPIWPFVAVGLVAILVAIGCVVWATRSASGLRWLAWVLASLSGSFAAVLLASVFMWW